MRDRYANGLPKTGDRARKRRILKKIITQNGIEKLEFDVLETKRESFRPNSKRKKGIASIVNDFFLFREFIYTYLFRFKILCF